MKARRWLLPFTYGVDMQAIDYAVRLAENGGATLVAVSLISVPGKLPSQGARLEHIQQSKDFLEAVKWKSASFEVQAEPHEVFTTDVIQRIATLTHDLRCDGIVLVRRGGMALLLREHEMKQLLTAPPASLVLLRLSAQTNISPLRKLGLNFLTWLHGLLGAREGASPVQEEH